MKRRVERRQRRRRRRARRVELARRATYAHLRRLAPYKLRRYGQVVGITGSIGKTSTKAAIVHVLRSGFSVDESGLDLNSPPGLLLSLFRQRYGHPKSARSWLRVLGRASRELVIDRRRYEKLVVEMAVGGPGDMTDHLRVFRPDVAVLTGIAPAHLSEGQFADEEAIFAEKARVVRSLERGTAILNRDDGYCRRLEHENLGCELYWYGRLPEDRPAETLPPGLYCERVRCSEQGVAAQVLLRSAGPRIARHRLCCPILGEHQMYVLLPAILVGVLSGLDPEACCGSLGTFSLPPGRMSAIPGIRSCTIIDSSFNASPRAIVAALEILGWYPSRRRIALLGSMNHLGAAGEGAHRAIGRIVPRYAQMLVTVGEEARWIAEEALCHGLSKDRVRSFDAAEEAGHYLAGIVGPGDVVLAKGSRNGIFLERSVELLMREPERADELLVRPLDER